MKTKYTHKFIVYNKKRIKNNYKGLVEKLADFDKEPIPKSLLENLNIKSTDELLNKSYALSLSDQYWIKEENQENQEKKKYHLKKNKNY